MKMGTFDSIAYSTVDDLMKSNSEWWKQPFDELQSLENAQPDCTKDHLESKNFQDP